MKRLRCTLPVAFVAAGSLGLPHAARAQLREADRSGAPEPTSAPRFAAELMYTRGIGAERCPDETALRDAVATRLGQDPFGAARGQRFRVELMLAGDRFVGRIALLDDAGNASGVREFEGSQNCGELVTAMALAVSLAINPNLVLRESSPSSSLAPHPEPPSAPTRAAAEPLSVPSAPATDADSAPTARGSEKAKPAGGVAVSVGAFALGALGVGPSANFGASLAVRLRVIEALSITLEGRADTPATGRLASGGSVKTQLYAGVLAPCWHVRFAAGCAVALLGRYHAESRGLTEAGSDSALYAALGGRLAAEYPLSTRFSVQIRAEVLRTLMPPTLWRNGRDLVWSAPPVSGGIGLGLFGRIL